MKMDKAGRRFRMQALAAAVGLASGAAQAAHFVVSNLNDSGVGSLRQALSDAQGDGGEPSEITFASGVGGTITLSTPLPQLDHSITILGQGITLAGSPMEGSLLEIYLQDADQNLVISGLTISGTSAGAIEAYLGETNSSLTLDGVTISGNQARSAVTLRRGDFEVVDSVISGNNSDGSNGAGINVAYADLLIRDSRISDNDAQGGSGGGISGSYVGLTIERSVISGNRGGRNGGGVRLSSYYNQLTVSDSTISGNTSARGAGIHVDVYSGSVSIFRSSISNNSAESNYLYGPRRGPIMIGDNTSGGGIEFRTGNYGESSFELRDSIVQGNTAGSGAGIVVEAQSVDVIRSLIRDNTATQQVGGFDIEASSLQIIESTVTGNTAAEAGIGALSYINEDSTSWLIDSSTLSDNTSTGDGEAAALAVEIYDGTLTIANSTISGNSSVAPVMHVDGEAENDPQLNLVNSTFSGNSSDNPAVFRARDVNVEIVNSTFVDNAATASSELEVSSAQLSFQNDNGFGGSMSVSLQQSVFSSGNDAEVAIGGQQVNSYYSFAYGEGFTKELRLTGDNNAISFSIANVIMTSGLGVDIESSESGEGSPLEVAAGLSALGYRGGFTLVHEPATGSAAIDAGPSDQRADDRDQRGLQGYSGEGQDLGSVEVVGNQPPRAVADVGRQISGVLGKEIPPLDVAALFTDADGDEISVVDVSGLPAGLYFGEGAISGTLEVAGTYHVTVVVEDSNVSPLQAAEQVVVSVTETARKKKDDGFLGSLPAGLVALLSFCGLMRRRVMK